MEKKKDSSETILKIAVIITFVVLLAVAGVTIYVLLGNKEDNSADGQTEQTNQNNNDIAISPSSEVEKWQEGDIRYKDKLYRYNDQIKTYLFMGIDSKGPVAEAENSISGGQSDAMFLLVEDPLKEKLSVIAINRNTMTPIDVYYEDGTYNGRFTFQICLQHAYGDGKWISCERSVEAVSRLFYNIPISGYLSLNMDGISLMNDALGGVTLEVLEDMSDEQQGIELKKGETVTLFGSAATLYLRGRSLDTFNSASARLERQQQYLLALAAKLKETANDNKKLLLNAYNEVEDYVVNSVDFAELIDETSGYSFDSSDMYSIPGEMKMGERFEEYYVDEEALYDLIIQVFYVEVE
ncbi:MAG: LCP family protein [Wujia sp.]